MQEDVARPVGHRSPTRWRQVFFVDLETDVCMTRIDIYLRRL